MNSVYVGRIFGDEQETYDTYNTYAATKGLESIDARLQNPVESRK